MESVSIKNREVVRAKKGIDAIAALDIDSAKVVHAVARTQESITKAFDGLGAAEKILLSSMTEGKAGEVARDDKGAPKWREGLTASHWQDRQGDLMDEVREVDVHRVSLSKLFEAADGLKAEHYSPLLFWVIDDLDDEEEAEAPKPKAKKAA